MSDFSELDLLESKLKHLIKELSTYNQVHKLLVIPKDSPCCVRKDDRYVKRSKCDTRHIVASCSSEDDLDNSSGTESEYLEKSSNSMFSTLKQLQQIEKGLRKKELEIKKKELQERINTVKQRLEQQKMSRKMSEVVLKKRGGKAKENCRHISKHNIRDDSEYKKKMTDVLRCAEISDTTLTTDSKADNCECTKDGSRPNNSGVCTCLKKKISFKTACCSTNSLPCSPNFNTVIPENSKKKLHDKKRKNNFKGMLTKWQGVERSYWSPCRCEAATHQASSLERMVQDAYGDCFPMTLRRNPMGLHIEQGTGSQQCSLYNNLLICDLQACQAWRQNPLLTRKWRSLIVQQWTVTMSMYDRPKSLKKPRCVWCRSLWLLCVKLLCSPCLLCFVCCYTCCYPPDDQMCKYSAEKVAIID